MMWNKYDGQTINECARWLRVQEVVEIPAVPYYVKLTLTFEEGNGVSGYQYFFRVLSDHSKEYSADTPADITGELGEARKALSYS